MRQTWRWFGPKDGVGIDEMINMVVSDLRRYEGDQ